MRFLCGKLRLKIRRAHRKRRGLTVSFSVYLSNSATLSVSHRTQTHALSLSHCSWSLPSTTSRYQPPRILLVWVFLQSKGCSLAGKCEENAVAGCIETLLNSFESLNVLKKFRVIMNKEGGLGSGGGGGPTAAAAAAAAQKQKTLLQRVDADIGNIVDNFSFLVNVAKVNDLPVRNSQEVFMMEMRATRMVQAADSLLNLVSELKQTAIFSGFASLNDHVEQRTEEFTQQAEKTNCMTARVGEEAAASLKELESHYYSSAQRTNLHSGQ